MSPTKVPLNTALNHQLLRVARWPINKEPVHTGQLPVVIAWELWECAPQLPSIDECRISSIVEWESLNCGGLPLISEALCARLASDSDLQPIRIKGADNWQSPFVFLSRSLSQSRRGSKQGNAHMCAIRVYEFFHLLCIVLVYWSVEGEEGGAVERACELRGVGFVAVAAATAVCALLSNVC